MIKIAFYLDNQITSNVDCRDISHGNPGIGGAVYAMLVLASLLSEKRDSNQQYYMFAESIENLPPNICKYKTPTKEDLSAKLKEFGIDILVVNKIGSTSLDKAFFAAISSNRIKVIIWNHCFIPYKELSEYSNNSKVARIVAVGKEQYYTWCDHSIYRKATYIYNICNYPDTAITPFEKRGNNVVYIGSIVPLKGLHLLTEAWPSILKRVPDAQLYIIGGGNLYNKDAKLSKFGITEYFYEKKLLKPILQQGKILDSVHFCGIMGTEKTEILNKCKVGVPNPSGLTETFGFTAIEMQLAGCLVTTKKCPGYLDTVYPSTGLLYDNNKSLPDCVVELLSRKNNNIDAVRHFVKTKFDTEKIIEQWMDLFSDVYNDKNAHEIDFDSNYQPSHLQYKNKLLQKKFPIMPSVLLYRELIGKITYLISKLMDFSTTIHKVYRRKIKKNV